jgi:hypothetical protein
MAHQLAIPVAGFKHNGGVGQSTTETTEMCVWGPPFDMSMLLACNSVQTPGHITGRHFVTTLVFPNASDNRQNNLTYHQNTSLECKHPREEEEKAGVDLPFARQL